MGEFFGSGQVVSNGSNQPLKGLSMTKKKGSNADTKAATTKHTDGQGASGGLADDQANFEKNVEELCKAFRSGGDLDESDGELEQVLVQLILEHQRLQRGVANDERLWPRIDEQTLKALADWDTDDPALSTIQKVFNRLADGRGESGVALLKKAIEVKELAISEEQRRKAKTQREANPLDQLIADKLKRKADISKRELLEMLEASCPNGVVRSIEDGEIVLQDPDSNTIKVSGLGARLSRIRKKSR
jgi:hypothetical protein